MNPSDSPIMTVVMLAIFTVMVGISTTYPAAARFMVLVVGIPGIALCLLQLGLDIRRRMQAAENGRTQPDMTKLAHAAGGAPASTSSSPLATGDYSPETTRKEIILWSYFLSLIAGVLLFGFYFTVPVFLIVFLLLFAQASLLRAAVLTVSASVFLYIVFEYVFRMRLHEGFITEYLMDRISG